MIIVLLACVARGLGQDDARPLGEFRFTEGEEVPEQLAVVPKRTDLAITTAEDGGLPGRLRVRAPKTRAEGTFVRFLPNVVLAPVQEFWIGCRFVVRGSNVASEPFDLFAVSRVLEERGDKELRVRLVDDGKQLIRVDLGIDEDPGAVLFELPVPRMKSENMHELVVQVKRGPIGQLRVFVDGTTLRVINGTQPVGDTNAVPPFPVFGVSGNFKMLPAAGDVDLILDNVRFATGVGARELVDPSSKTNRGDGFAPEGEPIPPSGNCLVGELGCFCNDGVCERDDTFCSLIGDDVRGFCSRGDPAGGEASRSKCNAFGVLGCSCAGNKCMMGLECRNKFCVDPLAELPPIDDGSRNLTAFCAPIRAQSCEIPTGVASSDWFVVIVGIVLIALALIRWTRRLISGGVGGTGGRDESAQMGMATMNEAMLLGQDGVSMTMFRDQYGGQPALGNPGNEQYGSTAALFNSSDGSAKRENYAPLPPAPDTFSENPGAVHGGGTVVADANGGVFEIYSRLPGPPALSGVGVAKTDVYHSQAQMVEARVNQRRATHMSRQQWRNGSLTLSQRLTLLWNLRIGSGQVRVRDAAIAVVYVLLHIGFFVGFQDPCLMERLASGDWQRAIRAAATTFGYMLSANGFVLVLPATRNSVLTVLLGMEFDESILFHRWVGRWTLFLLFLHGLLYFPIWFASWEEFVACRVPLAKFRYALTALFGSIVLVVTSLQYFRRGHFQFFYWTHFSFLVFFAAGALHSQRVFLRLAVAAMLLYVLDRLVRFFYGMFPRRCVANRTLGANLSHVTFKKHPFASYAVGNYVFLNFPQISFSEWHPFTLSSGPYDEHNECHIKALGDFTIKVFQKVTQAEATGQRLWVRVDGPYGHFSLNHERFPVVVLVGGGVGITPQIACLKAIYRIRMSLAARIDHARRGHIKHVYFVWNAPNPEAFEWFADIFAECLERQREDPSYPKLHLYIHLTKFAEVPQGMPDYIWPGRCDVHLLMRTLSVDRKAELEGHQGAVFLCGPGAMVNGAWDGARQASLAYPWANFAVHSENFDF